MKRFLLFFGLFILLAGVVGYLWLNTVGGYELRIKNMMVLLGEPDKSDIAIDGPYIFYNNDSIVSYSVNADQEIIKKRFPKEKRIFTSKTEEGNYKFKFKLFDYSTNPNSIYTDNAQIFVLSDIEGNFVDLRKILIAAGVMNKQYDWVFDKGHLVLLGDFMDRGWDVMPCLWLCYELQRQAELVGGNVHYILGNHEFMSLTGDSRYVDIKYRGLANALGMEYKDLLSKKTELGRWLRTRNSIIKIGEYAFAHGGISPKVLNTNLGLEQINNIIQESIDHPTKDTSSINYLLTHYPHSPLWYRRYVRDNTLSPEKVNSILSKLQCSTIFIGHTSVERIRKLYSGKIIDISVHHRELRSRDVSRGVLIVDGKLYGVSENGKNIIN